MVGDRETIRSRGGVKAAAARYRTAWGVVSRSCAILIFAAGVGLAAADYPVRPITLIVPYPPGGGNDVIARLVTAKMSTSLGQPIVIENRGGAGSTIGTRDAARSAADGYTLLIATSSLAINPSLYADAAYDPRKDFAPVGLIGSSADMVLVAASSPLHSIADLIALGRARPGLDFASTGIGTSTHLAAALFATMAGITLTAVPYKGVASALTDLMGGQVALMFCPMASVAGLAKESEVRALAVTGGGRSPLFPEVPTVAEAGLPGYAAELHYGLVAPAGTPSDIIVKLNAALNAALGDEGVRERLAAGGVAARPDTPRAYADDIAGEEAKWSAIIRSAGIRAP